MTDLTTSILVSLGIILIILGVTFLAVSLIVKLFPRLEDIHPLLILWFKTDGLSIGTSPILIIVAILIYLLILLLRKG